jgi:hypothetical protein
MFFMTGFNIVAAALFQKSRAYVEINNGLYRNMDLTVHCKSKNDDLGAHTLKPNATCEFDFKPNFWGRTRYFCNFQWKYANGTEESFWFDIYKYSRDSPRCGGCRWRVDSAAPCQYDLKTLEYDICYDYHS